MDMKIKSVHIENFKRFRKPTTFNFCYEDGDIMDLVVLTGNNGTGKTTLMQAIGLLCDAAIKKHDLGKSDWEKYGLAKMPILGSGLKISCSFLFNKIEIESVRKLYEQIPEEILGKSEIPKSVSEEVRVSYIGGSELIFENIDDRIQMSSFNLIHSFSEFYKTMNQEADYGLNISEFPGSFYWYEDNRIANSITISSNGSIKKEIKLNQLRGLLSRWSRYDENIKNGKLEIRKWHRNIYDILKKSFENIFKNRKFIGSVPKMDSQDILEEEDFFLTDGKNEYELAQISAGESAIFPILIDFANWNINNSIILIDELELHLHPPLQQALLRALPELGNNNQFIISTHSDYISTLHFPEQIIRLENYG